PESRRRISAKVRPWQGDSGPRSQRLEYLAHLAHGRRAMAEPRLLLRLELRGGLPALREKKDRVVAESARTARPERDLPLPLAHHGMGSTVREGQAEGADEARRAPRGGDVLELAQKLEVVLFVPTRVGLGARITRAAHAGGAAQGVHADPRVVGDRRHVEGPRPGQRLLPRVLLEGLAVLLDLR